MRRTLASLLPALLSFPLIAPLILANLDAGLPACCRRNGQHHCSMGTMETTVTENAMVDPGSSPGSAIRADQSRCSYCLGATSARGESKVAPPSDSQAIFASLASHPAVQTQTEARYRVSFSRSRQKRGPPSLLS
jgi:hypothetical protein